MSSKVYTLSSRGVFPYVVKTVCLALFLSLWGPIEFLIPLLIFHPLIGIFVSITVLTFIAQLAQRQAKSYKAQITDKGFHYAWGVYFVKNETVPFSRIQDVVIGIGPWQRSLGLATLTVQNAAGQIAMRLPGLEQEDAINLKDALLNYKSVPGGGL